MDVWDVVCRPFGKVLASVSRHLLQLLDYSDYQIASIDNLQKQIALHRQIPDDNGRRLHQGGDIDCLGPYDMFSPHAFHDCDADEASEEEVTYSWDSCYTTTPRNRNLHF
jgi:hypothetical protein